MQKKRCSQWCIWGCSGPPVSSKMMLPPRREHSFHISTCRSKVLQNCSQWPSFEALWRPKSATSPSKDPQKKQQKINAIFVAPRTSKWPRNGLKIDVGFFYVFHFFWECACLLLSIGPRTPKVQFFLQKCASRNHFSPSSAPFLNYCSYFFSLSALIFRWKTNYEEDRKMKTKLNDTECEYSTNCFGVRRCHAAGVFNKYKK